ncbi:hypothetical protein BDP27DRAFT_1326632 [Rhodocollybia butyracea]|uniref:F-box domain-containing protein n=1 Tax=Rhodocollybia butyracea TaxID=206335 RepID=A0A9P5U6E7_9AGAR|nr:hypothetical protein BDP27DRAFT_1326632 [Rhodocollybia butyracea]
MSDDVQHSPLDSKSLKSTHSPTCFALESTYQELYTDFLAKSRHNDIPSSPAARATLRALIDQTRKDLQSCTETPICSQILRVLELQESLLAPIRILPSEVLTEIFQLVIEASTKPGITYNSRVSPKLSGCIFVLTWICFWWRDEALSNSTFWSTVTYASSSYATLPTTEVTAFLNECILRSGASVPMDITVSISRRDESLPALTTIGMLIARAHRWKRAAFSFQSLHLIDIIFPFKPSTHFPFLEDLSFQCHDDPGIDPVRNPILECHPPLQELELSTLLESYTDVIASRTLKVLKIDCYIGVSLARLLHMCPCLESLILFSFIFRENADAKQITCQSSLLALNIGGDVGNYDKIENGAWTGVTFPKLTELDVTLPDLIDHEDWEAAYDAERSSNAIKVCITARRSDRVCRRL